MKVEYAPPETPKLHNVVECGFSIRWETSKTLMQNARLKPNVKKNRNFSGGNNDSLFLK